MPQRCRREEHICQVIILLKNSPNAVACGINCSMPSIQKPPDTRTTTKHKVEALTDHQREILKQHDEGDMIELNKKMKEEALKLQKQNGEPVPTL